MNQKYLAHHVVNLRPSGIRKFFDIVATMKDVISLGIGEPDFTTPPPIIEAGIRALNSGETHYTSNAGLLELRQAVSDYIHRTYSVLYDPKGEVVITVGVSEALYLTMTALLNPGEEVIVPTPCFVSYQAEVILAGGVAVELATYAEDNFLVRPENLRAAITPRTKALLPVHVFGRPCRIGDFVGTGELESGQLPQLADAGLDEKNAAFIEATLEARP